MRHRGLITPVSAPELQARSRIASTYCLLLVALGCLSGMTLGCSAPRITADPVYFPPPPTEPRVVHLKSFNRLRELVPVRPGLLQIFRGQAPGPFVDTPAGIAYHDGHLYICDTSNRLVHDWDLSTGADRAIDRSGEFPLAMPVDVAVDDRGVVYVADTQRAEVVAFESGVRARRIVPPDRGAYKPVALAVGGGGLYVADIATHQIDRFSTDSGRHLGTFGGVGSEPGRVYYPMGIATAADGRVVVSDMMNARVQVFDSRHVPICSMGQAGNRYGDLGKPRHVAVGPDGTIFIADPEFSQVHVFDASGRLLMLFGGPEDRPGGTPMPVGVTVARSLPESVASLVPQGFEPRFFVFVTNTIGTRRIGLFAVR